jgi:hypothetical protein
MKLVIILLLPLVMAACGVKSDPVPPTQADIMAAKATPAPEPTPSLIKPVAPGYDQNNYDGGE